MAIVGLGNDVVEIARFRHSKRFEALAKRVLTLEELAQMHSRNDIAAFLAKRWAAKEAAAKALGTGIAAGIRFQDFHIESDERGRPLLVLRGQALVRAQALGVSQQWLALSDEREYAFATVILESN